MKKYLSLALAITSITTAYASSSPQLIWGTEATYAPFESLNHQGNIIGFDVDLENKICQVLHKSCQMQNAPFPSLIPGLQIGKFSAIIGGLAITSSREKVINFSSSYYEDKVILVSHGNITPANLNGKVIGVQAGTSFQHFLQKYYPNSHVNSYASNMNALADLNAQRVDAVLIDQPVFAVWQKQHHDHSIKTYAAAQTQAQKMALGLLGNGIGVAKNNSQLLKQINTALAKLAQNGSLLKLKQKWFGNVSS